MNKKENNQHNDYQEKNTPLTAREILSSEEVQPKPGSPYSFLSDDNQADKPHNNIPIFWKVQNGVRSCEFNPYSTYPGVYQYTLDSSQTIQPHPNSTNTHELIEERLLASNQIFMSYDGAYFFGTAAASLVACLVNNAPENTEFVDFSLFEQSYHDARTKSSAIYKEETVAMRFWKKADL